MIPSLRIGSKLRHLIALAKSVSKSEAALVSECCYDLLDADESTHGYLSSASCLNNDGVPLQLCLTSSSQGSGLRIIGDPGSYLSSSEDRLRSSKDTLLRILERSGASELQPVSSSTLSLLLPSSEAERNNYKNGFVWIAAGPDQPGVAFYCELAPLGIVKGWETIDRWLMEILPSVVQANQLLSVLRTHCVAASAGLEGSSLRNTRAKIYFRLREAMSLNDLGIDLFASSRMQDFLAIAMEANGVDLDGLVMSIGFSLSSGSLVDAKIDLCGHCLNHSIGEWVSVLGQLTDRFSLPAFDLSALKKYSDIEVAFIGMGLTSDHKPRLNLYLKHAALSGPVNAEEIRRSIIDATSYFLSTQREDGSWHDYHLPVGSSDQWVTAYIGLALAQAGKAFDHEQALSAAMRAAKWLLSERPYNSGWGYNGMTGPDADSTAIAIALFDELGIEVAEDDRTFLRDHWRGDEGVATYEGPEAWGSGHWDVTPFAYAGLNEGDRRAFRDSFERALEANQQANGFWRSYWWRNPYYSTLVTLEVLEQFGLDEPDFTLEENTAPLRVDNAFDLGCYIGIEWLRDPLDERLDSHLRSLLSWQNRDGSWDGSHNLRVTDHSCYEPWIEPKGQYYCDERSSLTTATIIRVLTRITCHMASNSTAAKMEEWRSVTSKAIHQPISLN